MNIDKEWDFIKIETHKEKPTKENRFKRELLFSLQMALLQENYAFYQDAKKVYLKKK